MQIEINPDNERDTEMKLQMVKRECLSMTGCKFNIHDVLSSLYKLQANLLLKMCLDEYVCDVGKEIDFFKKMGIDIIIIKKEGSNDN